jgi:hypothetical protein
MTNCGSNTVIHDFFTFRQVSERKKLFRLGMSVCVVEIPVNFFHSLYVICMTLNLIFDFADVFVCVCVFLDPLCPKH